MRPLLRDESGFTLVELIVVGALTVILMAGLSDMFASGLRAGSDASSRLTAQSGVRLAFGRLEFEAHCATTASLISSGAGVQLVLPSQCAHASGTYAWCVSGGSLTRYAASSCTGTGQTFISNVTTPTPFSCLAPVGQYPRLQIALAVDPVSAKADAFSATDTIDMHNAALTTSSTTACS